MKNLTERMPKDLLKWTAAGFALVATATAEYELARAIGMNEWIAAAVPGALDAYVVRALRSGREVLTSVVAMVGVNAASHLVTAGLLPVEWPLITAVSAIAPLVLWRVHALGTPGEARRRVLWGLPRRARTAEHASTEPEHIEHDRAPDNPEPPGTREHPEGCVHGHVECSGERACTVYRSVHDIEHKANAMGLDVPEVEHITGTLDLDVPDWVNPPSTPPVRVHAPYADHVHTEHADEHAGTRHLSLVKGAEHADEHAGTEPEHTSTEPEHTSTSVCTECEHAEHNGGLSCEPGCFCSGELEDTRTADDWNLEHVSTGTLTPEDTEHMERARELFHTIGGVPPFRALKHGTPGMGTDRAKRIRAALKIENEGTD